MSLSRDKPWAPYAKARCPFSIWLQTCSSQTCCQTVHHRKHVLDSCFLSKDLEIDTSPPTNHRVVPHCTFVSSKIRQHHEITLFDLTRFMEEILSHVRSLTSAQPTRLSSRKPVVQSVSETYVWRLIGEHPLRRRFETIVHVRSISKTRTVKSLHTTVARRNPRLHHETCCIRRPRGRSCLSLRLELFSVRVADHIPTTWATERRCKWAPQCEGARSHPPMVSDVIPVLRAADAENESSSASEPRDAAHGVARGETARDDRSQVRSTAPAPSSLVKQID